MASIIYQMGYNRKLSFVCLPHHPVNDDISIIFIFKMRLMSLNTRNCCCTTIVFFLCAHACLKRYLSFNLSFRSHIFNNLNQRFDKDRLTSKISSH